MSKANVYCCKDGFFCSCYRNEEAIDFRFRQLKRDELLGSLPVKGIGCILVLKGELNIEVGEDNFDVKQGEMFLLPSEKYEIKGKETAELICYTSEKLVGHCSDILMSIPEKSGKSKEIFFKLPVKQPLDQYLEGLSNYIKDGINCSYLFEVKQQEFFMIIKACYTTEELAAFFSSLSLHKEIEIKRVILENCSQAKSVKELAQQCGYSLSVFKRLFKEIFNEPVYQWMLQQKTKSLKEKLAEENVNLKEIINEFGFSSPAHFTKFCKQWLGMAPTKYIEEMKVRKESLNF